MSWKAILWVWNQKLKGPLKWVLMGIANYYDPDSPEPARPSLDVLAKRLGISRQSVITNIAKLVKLKLIHKVRDHHYGNNVYVLNMPKTGQKSVPDQVKNFDLKQVKNFDPILSGESYPDNPNLKNEATPDLKKDSEEWRGVGDRLYRSDTRRFHKLIVWIRAMEKQHYQPTTIRDALLEFESFESRNGKVNDWYPYLTKIISRVKARQSIKLVESRHKELKMEEKEWLRKMKSSPIDAIGSLSADKRSG